MLAGLGLIIQIYNGSSYDITGLAIVITDKKTKEQHTYRPGQNRPFEPTFHSDRWRRR
jgi:hypothetical protein